MIFNFFLAVFFAVLGVSYGWVPSDFNKALCNSNTSIGLHPYPFDCDFFYYCNKFGFPVVIKCPNGYEWDATRQRCACPEIAKCSCNSTIPTPTPTQGPTPTPTPTVSPYNPCHGDEFYPCPWDCSKFFHCDGSIAYLKNCPKGLEWDTKTNRCEWPVKAQCTTTNSTTPYQPVTTTPRPTPTAFPYNPCHGAEFYPCPWDCSKFFHCDGSIAYLKDCPKGLEWDTNTNRCEWPVKAQCSTTGSTTPRPKPTSSTKQPVTVTPYPYNPCHGAEFYPCPWDCSKFFHCDGTIAYLKDCPANLQWNTNTNRCDWPRNVHCTTTGPTPYHPFTTTPRPKPTTSTKRPITVPPGPYNPCHGEQFYPCPWDCSKFFHCDGTIAYLKDCPAHLQWNTKINVCDWPRNVDCTATVDPPYNPCHGAEFYPCPWDCSLFFHCDGTIAYLKNCPTGTEWDTKTNRCEWPDKAQCTIGRAN